MNAYVLMAFNAAGRSSKIVMAWPESENLTSADLSATAAEIVANMRAERRCVLDNRDEIMLLYLILELMAYLAAQGDVRLANAAVLEFCRLPVSAASAAGRSGRT